jgi:hypothetical protein
LQRFKVLLLVLLYLAKFSLITLQQTQVRSMVLVRYLAWQVRENLWEHG